MYYCCIILLFLSFLVIVWGGGVSGLQCGTCFRAELKPDSRQPPTPSLCVRRPGPCCCPLGQPSGLHTGTIRKLHANKLLTDQLCDCGALSCCYQKAQLNICNANAHFFFVIKLPYILGFLITVSNPFTDVGHSNDFETRNH